MRVSALVLACACSSNNATSDAGAGGHPGDGKPSRDGATTLPHDAAADSRSDDAPGGTGEPADLAGMTLYHNQVRAGVDTTGVAGGALPYLAWDPNLAALAEAWVDMCQSAGGQLLDHSSSAYRTNAAGYAYVGENIYAGTGTVDAHDAVLGDFGWATEGAYYDYATNTCTGSPTGSCGHYTQVVWRATTHVGCALHTCSNLAYPNTIVCNYGPGGNVNGEQPY